jgi:hypothetical protein
VVKPTAPPTLLDANGVSAVSEPTEGVYCLTLAFPVDPASETVAVSPEASYSAGGAPGLIAVNAQHPHCPGMFEVDTYPAGDTTATKGGFAFTVVIP